MARFRDLLEMGAAIHHRGFRRAVNRIDVARVFSSLIFRDEAIMGRFPAERQNPLLP